MTIGDWLKKNASTILTCFGAGGMVATVTLAIRATSVAHERIMAEKLQRASYEEGRTTSTLPKLTVMETVKICGADYIPTVAVGTASLICIFGANVLNRRQQACVRVERS